MTSFPGVTFQTKDPRVRIGGWGEGNWRTLVQDEPGDIWDITGPPYPTREAAAGHVDDVLADYFGDLPTRALLAERIERALALADEKSGYRLVERMVEALKGYEPQDVPAEPDLREHIIRLHPHLYSAGKARTVNTTQAQMAYSHAEDHRDRGSATHRHGPSHWERPDAWPAGWRDGSGVALAEDE